MHNTVRNRALMLIVAMTAITAASTGLNADTGTCGGASITLPFADMLRSWYELALDAVIFETASPRIHTREQLPRPQC